MATTYGGLTAYPASIEEGLAVHGFQPPKARVYKQPSSRGEYLLFGIVGVMGVVFVGMVLIPYVQRVGSAGGAGCAACAQAAQPSGWPWLA